MKWFLRSGDTQAQDLRVQYGRRWAAGRLDGQVIAAERVSASQPGRTEPFEWRTDEPARANGSAAADTEPDLLAGAKETILARHWARPPELNYPLGGEPGETGSLGLLAVRRGEPGVLTDLHVLSPAARLCQERHEGYLCVQPSRTHGPHGWRGSPGGACPEEIGRTACAAPVRKGPAVNRFDAAFCTLHGGLRRPIETLTESGFVLNRVCVPIQVFEGPPSDPKFLEGAHEMAWPGIDHSTRLSASQLRAGGIDPKQAEEVFSANAKRLTRPGTIRSVTTAHPLTKGWVHTRVMCDLGVIGRVVRESDFRLGTRVFRVDLTGTAEGVVVARGDVYGFRYQGWDCPVAFENVLFVRGPDGKNFSQSGHSGQVVVAEPAKAGDPLAALRLILGVVPVEREDWTVVQPLDPIFRAFGLTLPYPRLPRRTP